MKLSDLAVAGKLANMENSIEHGAVNVVAVNDPFIEPHYAVRLAMTTRDEGTGS